MEANKTQSTKCGSKAIALMDDEIIIKDTDGLIIDKYYAKEDTCLASIKQRLFNKLNIEIQNNWIILVEGKVVYENGGISIDYIKNNVKEQNIKIFKQTSNMYNEGLFDNAKFHGKLLYDVMSVNGLDFYVYLYDNNTYVSNMEPEEALDYVITQNM